MKEKPIIKVENLTKVFKLPHERYSTMKQHFVNIFRPKAVEKLKALDNVSFEINKGEFFGIIGPNGSGKSTLLKVLAQIYQPTAGKIEINGTLSPFIELGVGFNPELTARDNVFLNAAVLGLSKKETEERFDEIIKFAELEEFVEQKLKNFSSGMQVRLAFSIAIQAKADILLVDEVLAVGDASFQQKCFEQFRKLKKEGKTVIFVSHALVTIEEFCDNCIFVFKGKIKFYGSPTEAIYAYNKLNTEQEKGKLAENSSTNKTKGKAARITQVKCLNAEGKEEAIFKMGEDITVSLDFENAQKIKPLNFGIALFREDQVYCYGVNTIIDKYDTGKVTKNLKLKYKNLSLLPGSYYITAAIFGEKATELIDFSSKAAIFRLIGTSKDEGVIFINHEWS
jgi:ABC-type polysaccharide/polyol phosphate transport system ATPase subunit